MTLLKIDCHVRMIKAISKVDRILSTLAISLNAYRPI